MGRTLLVRGMLVGLVAALLSLGFASRFGEPQVAKAIDFESIQAQAAGEAEEPELVSRGVQSTIGLAAAVGAYGLAFGGLFGLAVAIAWGRIGRFGARATAALVALGAFVIVQLVPFLKYPANPPAVGDPDTIGRRTVLYLVMIAISGLAAAAGLSTGRRLAPRLGNWNATLAGVGVFAAAVAVAYVLLPGVNEVPADFPAVVLWRFRLASLGTQAVMWTTFGLLFGYLTERAMRRVDRPRAVAARLEA